MATATTRKTAAKPAVKAVAKPVEQKSRWATLCDQATANYEPKPDYMFDGTTPATPIKEPVTAEQVTALSQLIDYRGAIDPANVKALLAAVCGDSFDRIWSVVGREHFNVLMALIEDINEHFATVPGAEGDDLPGGA